MSGSRQEKKRVRLRPRRTLAFALVAIVLVPGLLLAWLAMTTSGARFVVAQIAGRVPGELRYQTLAGSLARGLVLEATGWRDGNTRVDIGSLSVAVDPGALWKKTLLIEHLSATDINVILPAREPAGPTPLQLPQISLPIDIVFKRLEVASVRIDSAGQIVELGAIAMAGALRGDTLRIDSLTAGPTAVWRVRANGEIATSDDYPLAVEIDWQLVDKPWSGTGRLSGSLAALRIEHELQGDYPVSTSGRLELLGHTVPVADLLHSCVEGCNVGAIALRELRLTHQGALDDYRFTLSGSASGAAFGASRFETTGRGTLSSVVIETLTSEGDAVVLDMGGEAHWGDEPRFSLSGRFANLNASLLSPSLSGRVDGRLQLNGTAADRLSATLEDLSGEINGYPLSARGRVIRGSKDIDIEEVELMVGENTLSGSGKISGRAIIADFAVRAPAIAQIVPSLHGSLNGQGKIRGSLDTPVVELELRGDSLVFGDWQAKTLHLVFASDAGQRVDTRLRLAGVETTDRQLGEIDLTIAGPVDALLTRFDWVAGDDRVSFELSAALSEDSVRGRVRRGEIEAASIGLWHLDQPFDFGIDREQTRVGAHAWKRADAALSIRELSLGAGKLRVAGSLDDMPLASLAPLLPDSVELEGRVNADVDLTRSASQWRGTLNWRQLDTRVVLNSDDARAEVNFPVVRIDARLDGADGRLTFALEGDNRASGKGDFVIRDVMTDTRIEGEAEFALEKLAWLGVFVPGIADLDGRLSLKLGAHGAIESPVLRGEVAWLDGAVTLTDLGVRLENINLSGSGDAKREIDFRGSVTSGGGVLNVVGQIRDALGSARELDLTVQGEDVKVVDWQDQQIWVSPDLTLGLTGERASIDGTINVPRAAIHIRELPPSAVGRSADVRVSGREASDGIDLPLTGRVNLELGKDVHVLAFGLDSDIAGEVVLSLIPRKPARLDGRLFLDDGVFEAWGQKLTIDRGNLFYAGPPDNPALDVQATRKIVDASGEVLAGVRLTGFARNPKIEIYSEPALSETETLAYLLLGRASFDSGGADGELLSQAALGLGLSQSSPVLVGIASGIGLDELSVSGSDFDATELVAGKQLNDDLYVRYSFGIFSEIGALLLRYRLSERLTLEAGAADSQSLDLLYSIEK